MVLPFSLPFRALSRGSVLSLRADLGGQQLVEEVGVGNLLFRGLLQARGAT